MRTICSQEIFTKKCQQQQIFDSDLKRAWHYNHVTFTPIAKNFMLYCRLIYMLSILCVRLTIKVKVGIPESFKVGWYPPKKTGSSHLKLAEKSKTQSDKAFRIALFAHDNVLSNSRKQKILTSLLRCIQKTDFFLRQKGKHSDDYFDFFSRLPSARMLLSLDPA